MARQPFEATRSNHRVLATTNRYYPTLSFRAQRRIQQDVPKPNWRANPTGFFAAFRMTNRKPFFPNYHEAPLSRPESPHAPPGFYQNLRRPRGDRRPWHHDHPPALGRLA